MALIAHPVAHKRKSLNICQAFIAGAPKTAKGHVFYGVNESNVAAWDYAKKRGEDWYYIDNSYFDHIRGESFRVTKNRLQVKASEHTSDGERFKALNLEVKPYHSNPRGYWLVVEQSPSFMTVVAREPYWLEDTSKTLGDYRPMRVRKWDNDKTELGRKLVEDLPNTWTLVTHTSAAAVTAVRLGVPVIVSEQHALAGMVCGVAEYAHRDQRQQFFGVLADNQWSLNEFREGKAWSWLNR